MIFDGKAIAQHTGGELVHAGIAGPVHTDSRRLPPGAWFIALTGDRFDGHNFIPYLPAECAGVVISNPDAIPTGWARGAVVVPDTLIALQDLGRASRASVAVPTVGITGSAGKTTTRVMVTEVLRAVLSDVDSGLRVHHTQGNLNNHIGVPLTLCATPPDAQRLVIELGMNHPGEIALLQEIARPDVRVITNVGAAHVEGCGSIGGVAAAKQELFDGAGPNDVCIVNDDDPRIANMPTPPGVRVVRFGTSEGNEIRLTDVNVDAVRLQTRLRIETPDGPVRAVLSVPGAHLAECAMAAVACGYVLRVPVETMGPALSRFVPEGMRNRIERVHDVVVMNDAYNANPISMVAALRTLAALPGRKFAALGDMLELGVAEAESHRDVLRLAESLRIQSFFTGPRMLQAAAGLAPTPLLRGFDDIEALGSALCAVLTTGDALLIKGSRGSRMERVFEMWTQSRSTP